MKEDCPAPKKESKMDFHFATNYFVTAQHAMFVWTNENIWLMNEIFLFSLSLLTILEYLNVTQSQNNDPEYFVFSLLLNYSGLTSNTCERQCILYYLHVNHRHRRVVRRTPIIYLY